MSDERVYALPVERGCGTREEGGVYWETESSPSGHPVEYFLACPPTPVDTEALGIAPIGVKVVQVGKVWHVIDWVGSQHYPNVADYVEEVRRFGVSRRMPKSLDFSKLTAESRILLLHSRAVITHPKPYWDERDEFTPCPKEVPGHPDDGKPDGMCATLWWEDLTDLEDGVRVMPSFRYEGHAAPATADGEHQVAIFASFPLGRLVVVEDAEGECEETFQRMKKAVGVRCDIVEA